MAHHLSATFVRAALVHPTLVYLLAFLVPIAAAYWFFALAPYLRGRPEDMLSSRHVCRPAVPGVLERYDTSGWAMERHLSPFGRWVSQELARQNLSLAELAQRGQLSVDTLISLLYGDTSHCTDSKLLRTIATVLGAGEQQIRRLLRAELSADGETLPWAR
jgi:hypothetical protein